MWFDVVGPKLEPTGATMRERPTVVMLHGGPGFDHSVFRPAFDELSAIAQVVYVDHSGHGRSDPTEPEHWTLQAWADDVLELCRALDLDRPIVLGWSFGGMVAMQLACSHPDSISALVLVSTAARLPIERLRASFAALGGQAAGDAAATFWSAPSPATLEPYVELCQPLYSPQPLDAEAASRSIVRSEILLGGWSEATSFDLRPQLRSITCRTLVVTGALDPVTPLESAHEVVDSMPPGLARLEIMPASGHFIAETEPVPMMRLIGEFVAGLGTSSAG
jgi:proline iminopeptidase